jgi:hypothetical protein
MVTLYYGKMFVIFFLISNIFIIFFYSCWVNKTCKYNINICGAFLQTVTLIRTDEVLYKILYNRSKTIDGYCQ